MRKAVSLTQSLLLGEPMLTIRLRERPGGTTARLRRLPCTCRLCGCRVAAVCLPCVYAVNSLCAKHVPASHMCAGPAATCNTAAPRSHAATLLGLALRCCHAVPSSLCCVYLSAPGAPVRSARTITQYYRGYYQSWQPAVLSPDCCASCATLR